VSCILVIDDDPDIRLLLRYELSPHGHDILEAGDGLQALAAIDSEPIDVVLLDMMMPVLDGWQVLKRMDTDNGPPVVVITAMSSEGDRHVGELLELGALDVIAKPFEPDWLVRLIDAVLLVEADERDEYRRRRMDQVRGQA
jgi:DNA-binding response OmpR family regulator